MSWHSLGYKQINMLSILRRVKINVCIHLLLYSNDKKGKDIIFKVKKKKKKSWTFAN